MKEAQTNKAIMLLLKIELAVIKSMRARKEKENAVRRNNFELAIKFRDAENQAENDIESLATEIESLLTNEQEDEGSDTTKMPS